MENLSLNLAHLYPDLLNIYGDLGNVTTLKYRCRARNIDLIVHNIFSSDIIKEDYFDFYFIGGGQDGQQVKASFELNKNKETLMNDRDKNVVFLSICGGYQLFGNYYQPYSGEKLEGIKLLDCHTVAGNKRFIGNVAAEFMNYTVVGFENHSGLTFLSNDTKPLFKLTRGKGNNGVDGYEGARFKNVFGTYLHGPILPKNPKFADYLIELAIKNKYGKDFALPLIDDKIENLTHKKCLKLQR